MRWTIRCTAVLSFSLLPVAAHAQSVAGHVIWTSGEVSSLRPDKVIRPLAKGDRVHPGDIISTGPDSHVQILMTDQGMVALRPESSLKLTTYVYEGRKDGTERAVVDLIKGGVRSITGAIGAARKDHQTLRGGNVLVGIRGTDHETFVVPGAGVYNRVTMGGTYLQAEQGRVDVAAGQVGFAPLKARPALVQRTPDFMHLTRTAVPAGAPFDQRVIAHGKRSLPEQAALPDLPEPALGNAAKRGWGKGISAGKDMDKGHGHGAGKVHGNGHGRR